MKQFQFEVKNHNNLRRELARVRRFCDNEYYTSIVFQIFTQLESEDEIREITNIIDHLFPESYYYGCQTFGNIFDGRLSEQKTIVVCCIFEMTSTRAQLLYVNPVDENAKYKSLQDVWNFCNSNPWVKGVEIITSNKGADLLGIGGPIGNLREDIKVWGGISISPKYLAENETYVFSKSHGMSQSAAIIIIVGGDDLHVDSFYLRGWEGLGKSFSITECDGKHISTIDDEPALNIYKHYLDLNPDDDFAEQVLVFPLLVEYNGVECIRDVILSDIPGEIDLLGTVEKGMKVRLSYGDKQSILTNDKLKIEEVANFAPDSIFVYSCAARKTFWGDDEVSQETEGFDEIAPTVGFYTRGEILRIGNYLHLLNSTMVICMIREGDIYEREYYVDDLKGDGKVTGIVPKLINYIRAVTNEFEGNYYSTMRGMAQIYKSMILIDYDKKTLTQLDNDGYIGSFLAVKSRFDEKMKYAVENLITEESLEKALEFADMSTMRERLRTKNTIYTELISKRSGWLGTQLIVINRDKNGMPEQVVFTTQIIDAEKKKEEALVRNAYTDSLTGLLNRRAYERDIKAENESKSEKYEFAFIGIDINGLKSVNDALGHDAGDEIVVATADCIKRCMSTYGQIYRIGGDEFAAILYVNKEKMEEIIEDFDQTILEWSGEIVESLSVSHGCSYSYEMKDNGIEGLIKIADRRMYAAKEAYYRNKGVDRRGQRGAFNVLTQSYVKMLKVNLIKDSFEIISVEESELDAEHGYAEEKLSRWLQVFAYSKMIHPDDREKFIKRTGMVYLREFFSRESAKLTMRYRRLIGDEYREVLLEMVPSKEFTVNNKILYLYVKDISEN